MGILAGYDRILNSGLNRMRETAACALEKTDDEQKRNFYHAVEIVCRAATDFAVFRADR